MTKQQHTVIALMVAIVVLALAVYFKGANIWQELSKGQPWPSICWPWSFGCQPTGTTAVPPAALSTSSQTQTATNPSFEGVSLANGSALTSVDMGAISKLGPVAWVTAHNAAVGSGAPGSVANLA